MSAAARHALRAQAGCGAALTAQGTRASARTPALDGPQRATTPRGCPPVEVALIGAAIGDGAPDPGCRAGAAALAAQGLAERLAHGGRPARWSAIVEADARLRDRGAMAVVQEFCGRLAAAVGAALARHRLPLVVGGDHSCAVGTWSAAAMHLRGRGGLGLVWIDAHLDSHTPQTSPTQSIHGMPLAALLGHGPRALTDLWGAGPKLDPRDVAVVGARSWEAGEAALLARLGVRVIDIDEVKARGFAACLRDAVGIATARCAHYGVSFDVDALDPCEAPGTGTPVEGGIRLADALSALAALRDDPRLAAAEIVEYDPYRDPCGRTARAVLAIAEAIAADTPSARRKPPRHAARGGEPHGHCRSGSGRSGPGRGRRRVAAIRPSPDRAAP